MLRENHTRKTIVVTRPENIWARLSDQDAAPRQPAAQLVLLCHKFRCLLRAAQHGQRESVVTRVATNLRRIVQSSSERGVQAATADCLG